MSEARRQIVDAVKRYHRNRKTLGAKWDKAGDIAFFDETASKLPEVTYWQASTGSFWVTWKNGEQTLHNERQAEGIVVAKRGEDGEWHNVNGVDFITGETK